MRLQDVRVPVVRPYEPGLAGAWDDLVRRSCNGTMLHTRRFISYHGDRFRDRSLILQDRRGKVVAVFPAAEHPADSRAVVSHPGLTYGGIVHDGSVRGAAMLGALEEIVGHYGSIGCRRLRYKAVPAIYHAVPAQDDLYALFRLGARRCRCDLSAAIDLSMRGPVSQRRARSLKKAAASNVVAEESWDEIEEFWGVLERLLAVRHGVSPVHSLDEIRLLRDRFPEEIMLIAAKIGAALAGGALLFHAGPVLHMQYTATTERGREAFATDPVMERAIDLARKRGCRFFDFGTCTVAEGQSLNQGLYQFKASFGAGGVVYEQYECDLP